MFFVIQALYQELELCLSYFVVLQYLQNQLPLNVLPTLPLRDPAR
jgi:hypothetical protein